MRTFRSWCSVVYGNFFFLFDGIDVEMCWVFIINDAIKLELEQQKYFILWNEWEKIVLVDHKYVCFFVFILCLLIPTFHNRPHTNFLLVKVDATCARINETNSLICRLVAKYLRICREKVVSMGDVNRRNKMELNKSDVRTLQNHFEWHVRISLHDSAVFTINL